VLRRPVESTQYTSIRYANRLLDAGGDEPVGERDRRVLGGFNWSSQHLDLEVAR